MVQPRLVAIAIMITMGGALTLGPAFAQTNCPTAATRVAVGAAPPPPLAEPVQPPIPGYGYVWTPGYWGWNAGVNDYYWIPGVWVLPPAVGLYWTPAYWGWDDGVYLFNAGYWGPFVGFYGGIDYGFGYFGHGYDGGYWQGRTFYYNRGVNNLGGQRFNAVYDRGVRDPGGFRRVSYNGGPGGVRARPTAQEAAAQAHRVEPTAAQAAHAQAAAASPASRAGVNHGHPVLAAAAGGVAGAVTMHALAHHTQLAAGRGETATHGAGTRYAAAGHGDRQSSYRSASRSVGASHAARGGYASSAGRGFAGERSGHGGGFRGGSRASGGSAFGGGGFHGSAGRAPAFHASAGVSRPAGGGERRGR